MGDAKVKGIAKYQPTESKHLGRKCVWREGVFERKGTS